MDQSLFINMPEKLAELGYEHKQALLYGVAQEPYTFTLSDGSVHECGQGLGGLYRGVVALSRPDSPKAHEVDTALKTHKGNEERIVTYIRRQVEDYAPEGSKIRADLQGIINSSDGPADRINRFMQYMEVLLQVADKQEIIAGFTYAMLGSRAAMMKKLRRPADKKPFDAIRDFIVLSHMSIRTGILSRDDLEEVRKFFFGGKKTGHFLEVVRAVLEAHGREVSFEDVLSYMQTCNEMGHTGTYIHFMALAAEHFGPSIPSATVTEWINTCVQEEDYEYASKILGSVLGDRGIQCEAREVVDWMQIFTPNDQGREAHWEFYADAALAIVERGTRAAGAAFALQIPGINGSFTEENVRDWIDNLKKAGRNDLAAKIEILAFSKGFKGTTLETIRETVANGYSKLGFGTYETGVELHAYMIEHLPDGSLTLDDVIEWINEATRNVKCKNAHKIAIAAINKGIGKKDDIDHWVRAWYIDNDISGSCEIAIAAVNKKDGIRGFTTADIEAWVILGDPGYGQKILLAALQSRYAQTISPDTYKKICDNCLRQSDDGAVYQIILTALKNGNDAVLEQARLAIGATDIKGIFDYFLSKDMHVHAIDMLNSAAKAGKIAAVQAEDIKRWGQRCVDAGEPAMAFMAGLAAREAGIAVPNEAIQVWHEASSNGKTPEESVKNAGALMRVYRVRPAYTRSTAIAEEINRDYQKLMSDQARGTAQAITETTPYREAVRTIDAILFGVA